MAPLPPFLPSSRVWLTKASHSSPLLRLTYGGVMYFSAGSDSLPTTTTVAAATAAADAASSGHCHICVAAHLEACSLCSM